MNELEKLEKEKKYASYSDYSQCTVPVPDAGSSAALHHCKFLKRRICLLHAVHPDRLCKECFKGNSDCNSGSGGD